MKSGSGAEKPKIKTFDYCYQYPRPAVTTDCLIFSRKNNTWHLLLIERAGVPYKGFWALPGGFLEMDETLEQCAHRELQEETGLTDIKLEQWRAFSDPDRDPRGRTISVVFYGFADADDRKMKAGDDARKAKWFPVNDLPHLAFDHQTVIRMALDSISLIN